jgi:hypothetical protein
MNVQLGTAIAAPGSRATGWLAVETAPGEVTQIPVVVIHGGQPGPRLAITAGTHGGEYTGPAAMRSLLLSPEAGDPAILAQLNGSIIATLAASPAAFRARSIYVNPQDGKNLNRVYPGSATGSASERIAHAIATQLMTGADVYMDLHAGDINEALSPFVGIEQTGDVARDARAVALGRAVGAEWLLIGASPGTTTATAEQLGVGSAPIWAIITGLVAVVLAIFGYQWLHVVQRWITVALIIVLVIYVFGLAAGGVIPASAWDLSAGTFQIAPFFIQVSAAAAYQLSWAFFVSDYSRYMPADTPKGKIITWTSLGLFFGVFSFEAIGAVCTAVLPDEYVISALALTGDGIFAGLGTVMLIIGGAGLLGLMAMCVYGGSLTIITAMDSLRKVLPTRQVRIWTILLVGLTSTYAGAYMPADFLNTSFW